MNGTIDLGKFREPDVPKNRERERERKPFITLHPSPVAAGSALLLQVPGRNPKGKRKGERGPPPPKRPNLIRNLNRTKSPKGLSRFFTLTGTWHRVDSRVLFVVVGDIFFKPRRSAGKGMNRYSATLMPSSRPLPTPRSSPTFPGKGPPPL